MKKFTVALLYIFCFLFSANSVFAKTDLSISETDITFSKDAPVVGETIKIYTRVFNAGDTDVIAFVNFLNNGKEMAPPLQISIRPNTYDDVFIDWKAVAGNNIIMAKIVGANPADENTQNNVSAKKDLIVSLTAVSKPTVELVAAPMAIGAALESNSSSTDKPIENPTFLSADIQQGLNNFTNSNPIKSGIGALNNIIIEKATKWFNLTLPNNTKYADNKKDSFGLSKWSANASGFFKDTKNYVYAGMAIVFLTVLFLLWKGKKKRDEEY